MDIETLCFGPIHVFGNISPVRLLFRQTYLCKTTINKAKKSCANYKHFRKKNESVGRIFIYLFFFFLSIIFNANAHFASIIHRHHRFYTYKEKTKKLKLLIATANLSFLYY